MVSETVHDDLAPSRGGRLTTTVRDHWRALLVAWLATTVTSFGLLWSAVGDVFRSALGVVGLRGSAAVVAQTPLSTLLFAGELAAGAGVAVVALLVTGFAFGDVQSGGTNGMSGTASWALRAWLATAAVAFVLGVGLGVTVLAPAVVELLAAGPVATGFRPGHHPVWTAELAVFLPLVVGVALSLPAVVVAAVRGGAVHPRTLGSRWPVALLGAVLVAALFSPPDSLTFALYAGLLLAGYGAGTVAGSAVASGTGS
jgi:Sec-independent protein secretion pathway component TatC